MEKSSKVLVAACILIFVALGIAVTGFMTQLPPEATTSAGSTSVPPYVNLPPGCVKPADGFLIIANQNGYNDSIQHGAPSKQWPIINVKQGTTVKITVCNTDIQAHGFQVTHYSDRNIQTVTPGEVIHVSFVANSVGDFRIFCEIFCSIHIFMQNGLLRVTA